MEVVCICRAALELRLIAQVLALCYCGEAEAALRAVKQEAAHHMPGMVPLSAQPRAMRSAKNCQRDRMKAQAEATRPHTMTRPPSQRLPPSLSSTMLLGTCKPYQRFQVCTASRFLSIKNRPRRPGPRR